MKKLIIATLFVCVLAVPCVAGEIPGVPGQPPCQNCLMAEHPSAIDAILAMLVRLFA